MMRHQVQTMASDEQSICTMNDGWIVVLMCTLPCNAADLSLMFCLNETWIRNNACMITMYSRPKICDFRMVILYYTIL